MFYSVKIRLASRVQISSETIRESFLIITNDLIIGAHVLSLDGHAGISHDIIVRHSVLDGLDSCLQGLVRHGWLSRQNPEVVKGCVTPEKVVTRVDNSVAIVVSLHHGVISLIHGCSLLTKELDRDRGIAFFALCGSGEPV